jgi:YHS domain-containing protein
MIAMKNYLMIAIATAVLATSAFAAEKKSASPKEVGCAVMSDHKVNVKEATAKKMFADYKGNRYFFCCAGCPAEFKKDPSKFAKADHIPTPKK